MSSLKNLSIATAGAAFVVLGTVDVAQAVASLTLRGRVIFDDSGIPVSGANTTTSILLGGIYRPQFDSGIYNRTTNTNGEFSASTAVSPSLLLQSYPPTATILIAPTANSEPFLTQEFTVPSTSFRYSPNPDPNASIRDLFTSTETFRVKSVPEPLTILGSGLALGFGVLVERQYSKKRKKTKQIG